MTGLDFDFNVWKIEQDLSARVRLSAEHGFYTEILAKRAQ